MFGYGRHVTCVSSCVSNKTLFLITLFYLFFQWRDVHTYCYCILLDRLYVFLLGIAHTFKTINFQTFLTFLYMSDMFVLFDVDIYKKYTLLHLFIAYFCMSVAFVPLNFQNNSCCWRNWIHCSNGNFRSCKCINHWPMHLIVMAI